MRGSVRTCGGNLNKEMLFLLGVKDWSLGPSCYLLRKRDSDCSQHRIKRWKEMERGRFLKTLSDWILLCLNPGLFWELIKFPFDLSQFELLFCLLLLKSFGKHVQGKLSDSDIYSWLPTNSLPLGWQNPSSPTGPKNAGFPTSLAVGHMTLPWPMVFKGKVARD